MSQLHQLFAAGNELGRSEFFSFVRENKFSEPAEIALRETRKSHNFPLEPALVQIKCRRSAASKLSDFVSYDEFLFAADITAEQASNQHVAAFRASLTGSCHKIIDMTAGLGIDSFCLAAAGNSMICIEVDADKAMALEHNASVLALDGLQCVNADSVNYLAEHPEITADIIFVDPARRDGSNRRTYGFADCTPHILSIFEMLEKHAPTIIVKSSPMLDISQIAKELPSSEELHVICYKGECKEVMVTCRSGHSFSEDNRKIKVTDLDSDPVANNQGKGMFRNPGYRIISSFSCLQSETGNSSQFITDSELRRGTYLYDPNPGVRKLNAGDKLCQTFPGLKKISANTELYLADRMIEGFPGRAFEIISLPDKSALKALKGERREVIARNYVSTPEEIRKKTGVRSGSDKNFLIGFKYGSKGHPVLADCVRRQ